MKFQKLVRALLLKLNIIHKCTQNSSLFNVTIKLLKITIVKKKETVIKWNIFTFILGSLFKSNGKCFKSPFQPIENMTKYV